MPLSIQNGNELNWQGIFEMLRDLCQNHNNEDILMICSLLPFPFWFIEGENNLNQEYQTLWLSFDIYILAWASQGKSIASS